MISPPRRRLNFSRMTLQERDAVASAAQRGEPVAREELVQLYGPYVKYLCRIHGGHLPEGDREQSAWEEIWRVLPRWDARRGSFAGFVRWRVRAGLGHGSTFSSAVTVPRNVEQGIYAALGRARAAGMEWTAADIVGDGEKLFQFMKHVRFTRSEKIVRSALLAREEPGFLRDEDLPVDAEAPPTPEEILLRRERSARVEKVLQAPALRARLGETAYLRYFEDKTFVGIGRHFGVSAERARHLEGRMLSSLRRGAKRWSLRDLL